MVPQCFPTHSFNCVGPPQIVLFGFNFFGHHARSRGRIYVRQAPSHFLYLTPRYIFDITPQYSRVREIIRACDGGDAHCMQEAWPQ